MAVNCVDASANWPVGQDIDELKPLLDLSPWPCAGYDGEYDFACFPPASAGTWNIEFDLGVGAFAGNPYLSPGLAGGVGLVIFEIENAFKAHIILDAYFGINPGATVTMVTTATEVGGLGRVVQNSLDITG